MASLFACRCALASASFCSLFQFSYPYACLDSSVLPFSLSSSDELPLALESLNWGPLPGTGRRVIPRDARMRLVFSMSMLVVERQSELKRG